MEPTDREPSTDGGRELAVTIVMPAYNAAHLLPRTLTAALAAAGDASGVLVVDPGSDDGTADVAESLGARVIRLGRRAGPAEARNVGVEAIDADVALFIDSDCVAHPDVVERVRTAFAADAGLASLTGSYDDEPPDPGYASLYMNLRHHHTHQQASRENATFWAGCGAVRVDAFRRCGGFDADLYPRPMIEDIELGLRLREEGAARLDPELHVTHLKRWTVASVVTTDIFCRAVPWSRLIVTRPGGMPNDLNLRSSQRVAAAVAPFAILALGAVPATLLLAPEWAWLPALPLVASLVLNGSMIAFFARKRGPVFAVWGWLMHQVHLTYSALTFALIALQHRLGLGPAGAAK